MLKASWFAMALTLCCALGWSSAHAANRFTVWGDVWEAVWGRVLSSGDSAATKAAEQAAAKAAAKEATEEERLAKLAAKSSGVSIKNGKILLDRPIRITLPDGTKVEQSEFDIKTVHQWLGTGSAACLVVERCRRKLDENKKASSGAMQE
ncbi:hypothetical protein [Bradyrhizobium sp. Ai1a-2]|uniref:hypothetical protein n=1 Tax=Bradyrhizobium sp. Ai1a-2 TaxID=196490 RepID=UPI001267C890|nr:hypothetical protein [Bradyrhizobium sp. Ai1a-2]